MKAVFKRFLICVLAVSAAFAMTSCGKNDGVEDGGNAKPPRGDGTLKPVYSKGLEFTVINYGGEYSVTGLGSCTDTVVNVPPEYNGLPVTTIGEEAFKNYDLFTDTKETLVAVTIPDSVKTISKRAFWGIKTLTTVIFGKNVETVGEEAFYVCNSLTAAILPETATRIEKNAFCGCNSLETLVLKGATYIGEDAFRSAVSLKTVSLGKFLKAVETDAFYACKNLTDVNFYGIDTDLKAAKIGDGNEYLLNAKINFIAE